MLYIEKTFVLFLLTLCCTAIAVLSKVERLEAKGVYKSPNCNVSVTCYMLSYNQYPEVRWSIQAGPYKSKTVSEVPGFNIEPLINPSTDRYKQTVNIRKCYSKVEIKCKLSHSSKSIKLFSGAGISLSLIVGIVVVVIVVALGIGAFILLKRRRAAAKSGTGMAVTLDTAPVDYPPQTTNIYQQNTGYPPQPGSFYPQQQATYYPQQPATAYPPQQAAVYPPQPASAYPPQPAAVYPPQPAPMIGQDPPPYFSVQQAPPPGFK